MTVYPAEGRTIEVEKALLAPRPHMQCWRKGELPARFDYGRRREAICNPRNSWPIRRNRSAGRTRDP